MIGESAVRNFVSELAGGLRLRGRHLRLRLMLRQSAYKRMSVWGQTSPYNGRASGRKHRKRTRRRVADTSDRPEKTLLKSARALVGTSGIGMTSAEGLRDVQTAPVSPRIHPHVLA